MFMFKKYMALFLALVMLCGALTGLSVLNVAAADAGGTTATPDAGQMDDAEKRTAYYHDTKYNSPAEKLATMEKRVTKGNYSIYADPVSGEVAVQDLTTGQTLFTNPYDIGYSSAPAGIKNELMSQVAVTFAEIGKNTTKTYYSFDQAAVKDQIKVRDIKGGVRVEYTIGRVDARRLVPRSISEERFEEMILKPMGEYYGVSYEDAKVLVEEKKFTDPMYGQAFYFCKQINNFLYKSLDDAVTEAAKNNMLEMYPVLDSMNLYVLDPALSTNEIEQIERVIKVACPDYSYEEMDYDHQMTEYTSEEDNPPLFKLALEYTVDETGFNVRLPANSIRFNESVFEVRSLQVLPYLGAGNNNYDGYAFFPDGSGALFAFEDMKINSPNGESISVKLYGEDYAYHNLEMKYQQVTSYPVYGVVEDTVFYDFTQYDETLDEDVVTTVSALTYNFVKAAMDENRTGELSTELLAVKKLIEEADVTKRVEKRGFVAMIEEGEALTGLTYMHAGTQSEYDSIAMYCTPRPRDEYNLADAISVGNDKTKVSVVSDRKYVGNYRIHITMLSDDTLAAKAVEEGKISADGWYAATWMGMATAYRDRLVEKGQLVEKNATAVSGDIPLYIESFGAMETVEKILTIPVEVKKAMTSAKDVYTMYEQLSQQGVANINFKLTGFANGGMYATVPYGLKWEKTVSKDMSMQELFNKAAASDGQLNIYPDFDFSYVSETSLFDGFSMRKHAVRTIDDRYTYKREYMATQQRYAGYYQLAISPAYFDHFYTKLMKKYLAYDNVGGISVGTLGSALNSDFDEDEPYNREDAKQFVTTALQFISNPDNDLKVMVDGGNAYTWKYVDHILNAPIDSSRYLAASYSVPFLGVVLHGYVDFAGSPLNMEGDVDYAKLKAIENGASVYFTLSYQNTQILKEDTYLSRYYSVRYDIWFDDVVEIYNELNAEMKDLQTMLIIDHEFLSGMRVPDSSELDRDLEEEFKEIMNFQGNQKAFLEQMKNEAVADARQHITAMGETIQQNIQKALSYYSGSSSVSTATSQYLNNGFLTALTKYRAAYINLEDVKADSTATAKELTTATQELEKAYRTLTRAISNMSKNIVKIQTALSEVNSIVATAEEGRELILSLGEACPASIRNQVDQLYWEAVACRDALTGLDISYTGENLALQTFLELQYMLVIQELEGEENFNGEKVIGLLEKQVLALTEDEFGLIKDPVTYIFLRYLDANSKLSDAELDQKYGLVAGKSSIDGLVLYVRELLGEDIAFDPSIPEDEIDAHVLTYVKSTFISKFNSSNNYRLLGRDDKNALEVTLKYLHLNPYKTGTKTVNNIELYATLKKVHAELATLAGTSGKLNEITDGNYRLGDLLTEAQMKVYVDAIEKAIRKDAASGTVEYLTPDTMKEDIRNYIEVYYYAKVLGKILPSTADTTLSLMKTKTTSTDSLTLLVQDRINAYGITATGVYERLNAYLQAYESDRAYIQERIASINDALKPYYGDLTAELEAHYYEIFITQVLSTQEGTITLKAGKSDDKTATQNSNELRDAVKALLAEKMTADMSLAELYALADEVVVLHGNYPAASGYDAEENGKGYVYHEYFKAVSAAVVENVTNHSYFYQSDLAKMDAEILSVIEVKKAELKAQLGTDYNAVDYVGAVFNVLAAADTREIVDSAVSYINNYAASTQKRTLREDVNDYYTYMLLNCLESAAMTEMTDKDLYPAKLRTAVNTFVTDKSTYLLTKARGQGNYSMDVFMTDGEFTALVEEAYSTIDLTLFQSGLTAQQKKDQLKLLIKYQFYTSVIKTLNCNKLVSFSMYEIYSDTLEDSCNELKNLAKYYAVAYTNLSEVAADKVKLSDAEFESYFVSKDLEEDDTNGEQSSYVTDDGRIVAVTYGEKTDNGTYSAYKTFILNYNSFSVQVVYEGVTYTIPASSYVAVYHAKN